ncbi:MAG: hypothetical protein ACTSO2_19515 [Promethearchaeota archaeon]
MQKIEGRVVDKYIEPPMKNISTQHIIIILSEKNHSYEIHSLDIYYGVKIGDYIKINYRPFTDVYGKNKNYCYIKPREWLLLD